MSEFITHFPLPRDNANSIEKAIVKIRNDDRENLYIFKNSKQILRFRGESDYVSLYPEPLYYAHLKDSTLIHNHPLGSSFSEEDIKAAIHFDIALFILVTPNHLFQLVRPTKGWNIDFGNNDVTSQLEESKTLAENLLNKMVSNNEIQLYEMGIEIFHYIWSSFFIVNETKYERKKHN
jgi:hypothetical protein